MICYTALLIYRLPEAKLNRYGTHFSIENIIETLNHMEAVNLENMCYLSIYSSSQVCTTLNAVFGLGLDNDREIFFQRIWKNSWELKGLLSPV